MEKLIKVSNCVYIYTCVCVYMVGEMGGVGMSKVPDFIVEEMYNAQDRKSVV